MQTQDAGLSFFLEMKVIVVYINEMGWNNLLFRGWAVWFGIKHWPENQKYRLKSELHSFYFFSSHFLFFPHALHLQCALCYLHSVRCLIKAKTLSVAVKHDKNDLKRAGKEVIVNLNGVDSTVRDGLEDIYYIWMSLNPQAYIPDLCREKNNCRFGKAF